MVRDDRCVPIIINAEAMPILLHGVHLEHPGLQSSLNLGFGGATAIDIRLGDVFRVILTDPIDRLGAAPQESRNLFIFYFQDFFFYRFGLLAGDRLRGNHSREGNRQHRGKKKFLHRGTSPFLNLPK